MLESQCEAEDEAIDWHASAIRMVWSMDGQQIPANYERALVKLIHHHRQVILRDAASQDRTLDIGDLGVWVCTTPIGDIKINPQRLLQGFYRNFRTGEESVEKAYGETSRIFPKLRQDRQGGCRS